jgi:hypothetical protein
MASIKAVQHKKDSIVDTISAMEFCFLYGKCPVFAFDGVKNCKQLTAYIQENFD